MRIARSLALAGLTALAACAREPATPMPAPASTNTAAGDPQHQGITTPHGDHTPHHGGMVLMNGELHYEVVLARDGRHRLWFSNAVRDDLPASVARDVQMIVRRPNAAPEQLTLEIDDAGESWVARGQPIAGEAMVKVSYSIQGTPHDVEIPFVPGP